MPESDVDVRSNFSVPRASAAPKAKTRKTSNDVFNAILGPNAQPAALSQGLADGGDASGAAAAAAGPQQRMPEALVRAAAAAQQHQAQQRQQQQHASAGHGPSRRLKHPFSYMNIDGGRFVSEQELGDRIPRVDQPYDGYPSKAEALAKLESLRALGDEVYHHMHVFQFETELKAKGQKFGAPRFYIYSGTQMAQKLRELHAKRWVGAFWHPKALKDRPTSFYMELDIPGEMIRELGLSPDEIYGVMLAIATMLTKIMSIRFDIKEMDALRDWIFLTASSLPEKASFHLHLNLHPYYFKSPEAISNFLVLFQKNVAEYVILESPYGKILDSMRVPRHQWSRMPEPERDAGGGGPSAPLAEVYLRAMRGGSAVPVGGADDGGHYHGEDEPSSYGDGADGTW